MKSLFGLTFCIFLLALAIKAQIPAASPTPSVESEDGFSCGLKQSPIIQFDISVTDNENNSLKNLNYKDFEVFDENGNYEIAFFIFDKQKNHYVIGVYEDDLDSKSDWSDVKIKLKLLEQKENYGKYFVEASKAYRSDQD